MWNGRWRENPGEKGRTTRKRKLTVNKWDVYGSKMEQREYKELSSVSVAMTQVGKERNVGIDKWCENRSGWLNDRAKRCIAQKRSANRNYRHMKKVCGVDDERTERVKDIYLQKE